MLWKLEEIMCGFILVIFLSIWKIYGEKNTEKIGEMINNMVEWYEKSKEEKAN